MPGNLNLKKSWHPGLRKNQEAVWKVEQEAIEENKKIEERRKEIQRERERSELQALQDKATGKTRIRRMDWMYNDMSAAGLENEENEAYLLGKKRVEIKDDREAVDDSKRFEKPAVSTSDNSGGASLRDDPLAKIKQKQQELGLGRVDKRSSRSHHRSSRSRSPSRERRHRSERSHGSHGHRSKRSSEHRSRRHRSRSPRRESRDDKYRESRR